VSNPRTLAGAGGENCAHPSVFPTAIDSLGYNIDSDGSCELKGSGDQANKDPQPKDLICKKFHKAKVRHPRLRKRGLERAKLRVNVRP